MIKDLRVHGVAGPDKEFYATLSGFGLGNHYFHEVIDEDGVLRHRFFCGGNEYIVGPDGVSHTGNGGSFCPYMFGVDEPVEDLVKPDVVNRLVLFGARHDPVPGIRLTRNTSGSESFKDVFLRGHTVYNYYFSIQFLTRISLKKQQEKILRVLGKSLKRFPLELDGDDSKIAEELNAQWSELGAAFFLLKLVNRSHREFYVKFRELYSRSHVLGEEEQIILQNLAERLEIDPYSRERIKIDIMFRDNENRRVIDEYRSVLAEIWRGDEIRFDQSAKISRLRTLALRKGIPDNFLNALDEKLLGNKRIVATEVPEYLVEARGVLETILLQTRRIGARLERVDLIRLLKTKLSALENRDSVFDRILIEVGKECDEFSTRTEDPAILEEFGNIITYFDRFDTVYNVVNRMAFHEEEKLSLERARSLLANRRIFEEIQDGLFHELFLDPILKNPYLPGTGRKKIQALSSGLKKIATGDLALQDLVISLGTLTRDEKEYRIVKAAMDRWLKKFGRSLRGEDEENAFVGDVKKMLTSKGFVRSGMPDAFLRKALDDLKMERVYVSKVLPGAVKEKNPWIREEFIRSSGLDLIRVEELEREFQAQYRLEDEAMDRIRERDK
ncbi:hypothetical protein BMS3Abin14_00369 [bacterium BMS3Abin14]|nr:hypothetical protein BMS3Abin14_00369 [bacterium BMS3Abin14]